MPDTVTLKGNPVKVAGTEVKAGAAAPDATLSVNLKDTVTISSFKGKKLVLAVVPSLDTPVCDLEAQRFNKEAASLGDNTVVAVVSMDLPPAQARWCGANSATNIKTFSDHRLRDFGQKYGVYLPDLGIMCRAVFVIDETGTVKYAEYVPEIADQPNFEAALAALKA
ncbi:MAG: thioredoxin-dependent peroxiredoxin [Candidatus Sumerlaeota bacterium]|nr:thioredoxin-dependent peroxiredoxin [Candidatus Sumerlaeota bacterium]